MKIKEMSDVEKYKKILDYGKVFDTAFLPIVQKHLGKDGISEIKKIWNESIKPISENASSKEKY